MSKDVISKKNNGIRSNLKWSRYSKLIDKKGELVNTRQQEENEKKKENIWIYVVNLPMLFMMD